MAALLKSAAFTVGAFVPIVALVLFDVISGCSGGFWLLGTFMGHLAASRDAQKLADAAKDLLATLRRNGI